MKRQLLTTLLMGLAAAVLVAVAAFCYPWAQSVATGQRVNEPLFTGLKTDEVRNINVASIPRGESRPRLVQIRRVRDQWVIPTANNYPAGNSALIGEINNALSQAVVLEVVTDDEGRHSFFGVVDPDTVGEKGGSTGVGAKITLADGNNEPLASLIIGEQFGQQVDQRFVRIAGQPTVYVTQINPNLLATRLADWADHNLLGLKTSAIGPGFDIAGLTVDAYAIPEAEFAAGQSPREYQYRARLQRSEATWGVTEFSKPGADGKLAAVDAEVRLVPTGLTRIASTLVLIPFDNVIQVPDAARQSLLAATPGGPLGTLNNYGFRWAPPDSGDIVESANGDVALTTPDGLVLTLHFGRLMEPQAGSSVSTYAGLLTARVNTAAFPEPPLPTEGAGEEAQREFERSLKRREDSINAATNLARQFNERTSSWLYFIPEAAVRAMRPEEEALLQK